MDGSLANKIRQRFIEDRKEIIISIIAFIALGVVLLFVQEDFKNLLRKTAIDTPLKGKFSWFCVVYTFVIIISIFFAWLFGGRKASLWTAIAWNFEIMIFVIYNGNWEYALEHVNLIFFIALYLLPVESPKDKKIADYQQKVIELETKNQVIDYKLKELVTLKYKADNELEDKDCIISILKLNIDELIEEFNEQSEYVERLEHVRGAQEHDLAKKARLQYVNKFRKFMTILFDNIEIANDAVEHIIESGEMEKCLEILQEINITMEPSAKFESGKINNDLYEYKISEDVSLVFSFQKGNKIYVNVNIEYMEQAM